MKVLNLYAGIGGNRKLWTNCEVTAVELNPKYAEMYKERFPNDEVIIADAHEYLEKNYDKFDFIWSSPPCQTHSRANHFIKAISAPRYASLKLYEEIIFLQTHHKGKWCVENVIPYYNPLIPATKIGRHLLWSNFIIPVIDQPKDDIGTMMKNGKKRACQTHITERNAVNNELGLHIFNRAFDIVTENKNEQTNLFNQK